MYDDNNKKKSFIEKLNMIDRRIIFLFIAIAVIIPTLFPKGCKEYPTKMTQDIFDKIENLESGSRILLSLDYDPASAPELDPMTNAFIRHCCIKKHKIYLMTLWQTAPSIIRRAEAVINTEFPEMKEKVDYVNFGFKAGMQAIINAMVTDIYQIYSTDNKGDNLRDPSFEIMKNVKNLSDMDIILNVSTGMPGLVEWIQFGGDMVDVPTAGGTTAVSTPLLLPYYPHQMFGILGGIKGAAEYEQLLKDRYSSEFEKILKNKEITLDKEIQRLNNEIEKIDKEIKETGKGDNKKKSVYISQRDYYVEFKNTQTISYDMFQQAIIRMGPQTIAHLVIIFFIVVGNVTFFIMRRRQKQNSL